METRQQRLIRQALEHGTPASKRKPEEPETPAVALRDQSLAHTADDYVPKTLTPHEWEQYYREHGVPESHRASSPATADESKPGWLSRLFGAASTSVKED